MLNFGRSVYIYYAVPSQGCQRSCICVLGISILPLCTILIFYFGIFPTVWYFFFLFYITGIAQHVGPAIISLGGEGDEGCFYTDEGVICL